MKEKAESHVNCPSLRSGQSQVAMWSEWLPHSTSGGVTDGSGLELIFPENRQCYNTIQWEKKDQKNVLKWNNPLE